MVRDGRIPTQHRAESVLHSLLAEYIAPDCSSFPSCAPGMAGEQQHRALGPVWGCVPWQCPVFGGFGPGVFACPLSRERDRRGAQIQVQTFVSCLKKTTDVWASFSSCISSPSLELSLSMPQLLSSLARMYLFFSAPLIPAFLLSQSLTLLQEAQMCFLYVHGSVCRAIQTS